MTDRLVITRTRNGYVITHDDTLERSWVAETKEEALNVIREHLELPEVQRGPLYPTQRKVA